MISLVRTKEQQELLSKIWKETCEKNGFLQHPYQRSAEDYLLYKEGDSRPFGTIEFVPFQDNTIDSEKTQFSHDPRVLQYADRTFEVERFSIVEEEQGNESLDLFQEVILAHGTLHHVKFYIGVMNWKFYRILCHLYKDKGLVLEKTHPRFKEGDATLVPVLVDFEKTVENHFFEKLLQTSS